MRRPNNAPRRPKRRKDNLRSIQRRLRYQSTFIIRRQTDVAAISTRRNTIPTTSIILIHNNSGSIISKDGGIRIIIITPTTTTSLRNGMPRLRRFLLTVTILVFIRDCLLTAFIRLSSRIIAPCTRLLRCTRVHLLVTISTPRPRTRRSTRTRRAFSTVKPTRTSLVTAAGTE